MNKRSIIFLIVTALLTCIGVICTVLFWQPDLLFIPILAVAAIACVVAFIIQKKEKPSGDAMWDYLGILFGAVGGSLLALLIWLIFIK